MQRKPYLIDNSHIAICLFNVGPQSPTFGVKKSAYWVWWGNLRERNHLEDVGVDGRMILKCIFKKRELGGMEWITVAVDRDRWRAYVNATMNLLIP